MPASRPANPDPVGFGVYVHWPFCSSKCPYCDFNSHVRINGVDEGRFAEAFKREIKETAAATGPRAIDSVFFGGGTPSLMRPETFGTILDAIAASWTLDRNAEVTIEANPSSVEAARFAGYRAAGANRVSIGVQSLRDGDLKALGRLHTASEARSAIDVARRTFERFSFDLIYARPGQTAAQWERELTEAIAIGAKHLSLYQLTIEPETPFAELHAAGKLVTPTPELAADLYEMTEDLTLVHGLPAYEVSNYAAPGEESRHNLLYWRYGEYVGVGPGAHGRMLLGDVRVATMTERNPDRWLEQCERYGAGWVERAMLSRREEADEALLMGLRLTEGLDLERLVRIGGRLPDKEVIEDLAGAGLISHLGSDHLRATSRGRLVLNEVVRRLSEGLSPVRRL
jgi:oxygen-independent coproporphyrinogen-3 oxidase